MTEQPPSSPSGAPVPPPPPMAGPGEPPPFPPGNPMFNPMAPATFSVNKWPAQQPDGTQGHIVLVTAWFPHGAVTIGMPKVVAQRLAEALRQEAESIPDLVVAPGGLKLPPMRDLRQFRPGAN